MKTMPRLLLLLFCMSVVTMMFIARCGLNMEGQLVNSHPNGLPRGQNYDGSTGTPGEKALREVMRRKEVEHVRDKSIMQEKIKTLETKLAQVQGQVVNLTAGLNAASKLQMMNNVNTNSGNKEHANNFFLRDARDANFENDRFGDERDSLNILGQGDLKVPQRFSRGGKARQGLNARSLQQRPRNSVWTDEETVLDRPNIAKVRNFRSPPKHTGDLTAFGGGQHQRLELGLDGVGDGPVLPGVEFDRSRWMGGVAVDRRALGLSEDDMMDVAYQQQQQQPIQAVPHQRYPRDVGGAQEEPKSIDKSVVMDSDISIKPSEKSISNEDVETVENNKGNVTTSIEKQLPEHTEHARYIQERLELGEILKGQTYKTEYEMVPFNRFIFNRIYMVEPGLGKRVVEKPIGSKKKDLNEILFHAVETLNKNRNRTGLSLYTYDHFVEGIYRSDPASGAHYELYFTNLDDPSAKDSGAAANQRPTSVFRGAAFQQQNHPQHLYVSNSYVRVSIFRPFSPPLSVQQQVISTGPEWINLILPLSGRIDTFRIFMDQFVSVCVKQDKRVYLTVVYFGMEGLREVKAIMSNTAKAYKFKHMKLVTLNETFARGRGLQIGALNWKGGADVLMFFCDVDIMFMAEFFERCRLNSERGQRVYYPIVFSLYNPNIVYSLQDLPMPSLQEQLVLSKDTGFWRDFGYGMTCQYRSDFLKIKGFDEQITGWGGEDVFLYQKFVRSDYFVVRATDPAIFHLWHEKSCYPALSAEQYRSCIRSKALNEASHSQLGLLAFKDEIDVHRSFNEKNSILLRNAAALSIGSTGGGNARLVGGTGITLNTATNSVPGGAGSNPNSKSNQLTVQNGHNYKDRTL